MSRQEVDEYFAELPGWMENDVLREIQLARASSTEEGRRALAALGISAGGGNLLAALGLVAYTEALGLIRVWNRKRAHGKTEECFLAFFNEMKGGSYQRWAQEWGQSHPGTSIYEVLRCGLVHEYRPKVDSEFWIGDGQELGLAEENGHLIFKVEPYYRHFCAEADRLYEELKLLADPQIPPPHFQSSAKGDPPKSQPPPTSFSGPFAQRSS